MIHYRVIISLGHGSLLDGFPSVKVEVQCESIALTTGQQSRSESPEQRTVSLPPALALSDRYRDWKLMYQALQRNPTNLQTDRAITIASGGITNISKRGFEQLCLQLKQEIDRWFDHEWFRPAKEMLIDRLNPTDHVRFILETEDPLLWRIPWHQWTPFERYPHAEWSLTKLNAKILNTKPIDRASTVQILAILGDSGGLDLEPDIQAIQALPQVSIEFLTQPSRPELNEALWRQSWDILFFAGHSSSQTDRPHIALSPTASLTIPELNYALQQAIDRGLQLAIFNSCDGVGLAQNLADLNLPHGIVMRENVPDRIAQIFLKHFLEFFSSGRSLSESVRQSRLRLEGYEDQFPKASWLPALFEHPKASVLYWADLLIQPTVVPKPIPAVEPSKQQWLPAITSSLVITAVILGVRSLGALEGAELWMYDRLITSRPQTEKPDPRLLIVGVTEEDMVRLKEIQPISDRTVLRLLKTLQGYKPRVIGLDIMRDVPIGDQKNNLTQFLKQSQPPIITGCRNPDLKNPEKYPGYGKTDGSQITEIGFTTFILDSDRVLRRHLLAQAPSELCPSDHSLSLRLALRYFGIQKAKETEHDNVPIQNKEITILKEAGNAYQSENSRQSFRGYQILLNYRSAPEVATQVSMMDILEQRIDPNIVRDKIVLIGYVAQSAGDDFATAVSGNLKGEASRVSGVILHAQMTSQLISHVLDNRPLIQSLPILWENCWIASWGAIGGTIALLRFRRRWIVQVGMVFGLTIGVYAAFCHALWLPLVPAMVGLVGNGIGLEIYQRDRK